MTVDHSAMPLGKHSPRHDERTLNLRAYFTKAKLPAPPKTLDLTAGRTAWPMAMNDTLGDCTCAAASHMIEQWSGQPVEDADVLRAYSAVSGYNPATGANNNGAVESEVLKYWQAVGVGSHKIGAYAAIHPRQRSLAKQAAYLFDGLYIGIALPITAQTQDVWSVDMWAGSDAFPGSWGGHAVNVVGYDAKGVTVVTWGKLKRMTWSFWDSYVDEVWSLISADYLSGGKSPQGFDLAALTADLATIRA